MYLRRAVIGSTLLLLLATCGGSSPFTVNGTIHGSSLKSGDAVSAVGAISVFSTAYNAAVVVLSSSSGLCASATAGKQPKSSQFMTFLLNDRANNTAPTAAGTYTIWPLTGPQAPKWALAEYEQTDANCNDIQSTGAVAVSGTITITSISNGDVSGNFDFTFDSGDHVTGSFSAKNCNALISILGGNSTCG